MEVSKSESHAPSPVCGTKPVARLPRPAAGLGNHARLHHHSRHSLQGAAVARLILQDHAPCGQYPLRGPCDDALGALWLGHPPGRQCPLSSDSPAVAASVDPGYAAFHSNLHQHEDQAQNILNCLWPAKCDILLASAQAVVPAGPLCCCPICPVARR